MLLAGLRPALRNRRVRGHLALRQGTSSPAPLSYEWISARHVERRPVILSAAQDLCVRGTRSFAALRMTGRRARTSAHGRSSLQMSRTLDPYSSKGGQVVYDSLMVYERLIVVKSRMIHQQIA